MIWFFDQIIIRSEPQSDQIMIYNFGDPRSHYDLIFDRDLIFFRSDHPISVKKLISHWVKYLFIFKGIKFVLTFTIRSSKILALV